MNEYTRYIIIYFNNDNPPLRLNVPSGSKAGYEVQCTRNGEPIAAIRAYVDLKSYIFPLSVLHYIEMEI